MARAVAEWEIEIELCGFDADVSGKICFANSVEEVEVVIANSSCSVGTRDCLTELCEDETTTVPTDGGAGLQCVIDVLARHELARRAFYECAVEGEIVERLISRCGKQNRTSDTHLS